MEYRHKFIAWDTKNNCFFKDVYRAYENELEELYINQIGSVSIRTIGAASCEADRFIIKQCTGRKDKSANLIFEGFVYELKVHGIETHVEYIDCVVEWHDDLCAFGWKRLSKESEQPIWINMNSNILDMKYLGNVHENPELMKAAN